MSTGKRIYTIFVGIVLLVILIAVVLIGGISPASHTTVQSTDYESTLFSQERIHSIEIFMEDWESFLQLCTEQTDGRCSVVINGERFDNVGIRADENVPPATAAESDRCRYSLKLEFDRYNTNQSYHGLDNLNLDNLLHDNTMMKDYLSYFLMEELGVAAPLCSYTKLYVNNKSIGLYLAVEAVDESFLQRNYGSDYGRLYEPQTAADTLPMPGDVKLQYIDDDPDSYPNIFSHARTPITQEDRERLIRSLKQLSTRGEIKNPVDIEAVIRYFVVHTFVCNEDSYTGSTVHNFYLYEKDGKLSMLPRDYSLAFGGIPTGDASAVINSSIYSPVGDGGHADRPMLSWILDSKKYTWLYERYYTELLNIKTKDRIDRTVKMIRPYVQRDPTKFCTSQEFEAGVAALKQFLELRAESVQQQLSGKPVNVDVGDLDLSDMGGVTGSTLPPNGDEPKKRQIGI